MKKLIYFLICIVLFYFIIDPTYFICKTILNPYNLDSIYDIKTTYEQLKTNKGYYLKYKIKNLSYETFNFDKNGVLIFSPKVRKQNSLHQEKIKNVYSPVRISEFALDNYTKYVLSHNKKNKDIFLTQANWLVNNLKIYEVLNIKFGLLFYKFDYGYVESPWISSMAQGLSLSVLCNAYNITHESKYLKAATHIKNSFLIPVEKGGVTYFKDDYAVFEEYLTNLPTHVLNGFLFAWFGLYDYYKLSKDLETKNLLNKSLIFLKNNLLKYDLGYWTSYDYPSPGYSGPNYNYHMVQTAQLEILYNLTGEKFLIKYINSWKQYPKNSVNLLKFYYSLKLWKLKRLFWTLTGSCPYKDIKQINKEIYTIYKMESN